MLDLNTVYPHGNFNAFTVARVNFFQWLPPLSTRDFAQDSDNHLADIYVEMTGYECLLDLLDLLFLFCLASQRRIIIEVGLQNLIIGDVVHYVEVQLIVFRRTISNTYIEHAGHVDQL